jgi:hypothetical protein
MALRFQPEAAPTADTNPAFLVAIDCECGWRAGVPEGSKWPDCPYCNEPVLRRTERGKMYGYIAVKTEEKWAAFAVANVLNEKSGEFD